MKTIIYIMFCLCFRSVKAGEISRKEYLGVVSKAYKKGLLHDADAFKLTMKALNNAWQIQIDVL